MLLMLVKSQEARMIRSLIKGKMSRMLSDERGEVNIVAIVILIGIAVLLALIFKDFVADLLESLFDTIEQNATNAINPTN